MSQAGDLLLLDQTLFERARKRDVAAFAILVRRHADPVYRIVRSLCGSSCDLESMMQAIFLEAYRAIASTSDASFGIHVYRIAIHAASKTARQAASIAPQVSSDDQGVQAAVADWPELSDALIEQLELVDRIHHALGRVDEMTRAAFMLHEVERLPAQDVAAVLRTSPCVVRRSVHQTLLILRSDLSQLFKRFSVARSW